MTIPKILACLLLLVTEFFEDETISDEEFHKSLFEKLKEICRLAIEEKLEMDELIRLLTPLLDLLTKEVGFLPVRIYRNKFLDVLNESFSSLPLSFSLQKMDIGYRFVVEPITISLSIQGSIMYETNASTDCNAFLERFVRLYTEVTTPVIQFWILSLGIFEDIFSTFGAELGRVYLPPKVPKEHPQPFYFIPTYREFYKFDLFDQIFTILNKSVLVLKITSKDFHEILAILKKFQEKTHEDTSKEYSQNQRIAFVFLSALIGFQLRDMLSSAEYKKMVTDLLKIKDIAMLERRVKVEVRDNIRVSINFFENLKEKTKVDYTLISKLITEENPEKLINEYDALQAFYDQLNR